jgi:1-acyl-sn-glycerol-3-phosphate acyltransferase
VPYSPTPKPINQVYHPDINSLPVLTRSRRLFRRFFQLLCRVLVFVCTKATICGLENYPRRGPALVVINHLGDPDGILVLAALPDIPEFIGKIELRDIPMLRVLADMFGVIWIHRGQPDRRALSAALEAFRQGRRMIIAPEGRESVSGALEAGTEGAAFLALKAGVPVVPVTITGSEFRHIENNLKKLRRTPVILRVGKPFILPQPALSRLEGPALSRVEGPARGQDTLREGTRLIMEALARQLPPEYRGVYAYVED